MARPTLKLAPECQCFPLWLREVGEGTIFETIDPATLPISSELAARLEAWRIAWDSQYSLDDPQDALNGQTLDIVAFESEGLGIWKMLLHELGDRYSIIYSSRLTNGTTDDPGVVERMLATKGAGPN